MDAEIVWAIKDWDEVFETRHSRLETGPRRYVLIPADRQNEAYGLLMQDTRGQIAYAVFIGLARIACRCPRRGILFDDKGPYTVVRVSAKLRVPARTIEMAVDKLSSESVRWLRPASADEVEAARRISAGEAPEPRRTSAGKSGGLGKGLGTGTGTGTGAPQAAEPPERGSEKPKPATVKLPPSLDTPEFRTAWAAWAAYRKQARKPLTAIGAQRLLSKLEAWGVDTAVRAIDESIANGWQGVFDHGDGPAGGGTGSNRGPARPNRDVAETRRGAQSAREFAEPEIPMPIFRPSALAGAATDGGTGSPAGGGWIAPETPGQDGDGLAG